MSPTYRRGSPAIAVDVTVEAGDWPSKPRLRALVRRAVSQAARHAAPSLAPDCEVSILFTDDHGMQALNARYRGKNRPTDVLSLPAAPMAAGLLGPPLGDIVLAAETIRAEAAAGGLALEDHLTHLIVHGFLHLVGHDHLVESEALVMEGLETAILGDLGIADPYAATGAADKR